MYYPNYTKNVISFSCSYGVCETIGLFTLNTEGVEGSILVMLSHGLVSSPLFLCAGI